MGAEVSVSLLKIPRHAYQCCWAPADPVHCTSPARLLSRPTTQPSVTQCSTPGLCPTPGHYTSLCRGSKGAPAMSLGSVTAQRCHWSKASSSRSQGDTHLETLPPLCRRENMCQGPVQHPPRSALGWWSIATVRQPCKYP